MIEYLNIIKKMNLDIMNIFISNISDIDNAISNEISKILEILK